MQVPLSLDASHDTRLTLSLAAEPLPIIDAIHARGMRAGVAISPDTPSTAITNAVGEAADMLLVMTVYPGRGGQKFLERCVPKVAELRHRFPHKDIEVDGGVSPSTVGLCAHAGTSLPVISPIPLNTHDPSGSNVIVAGTAVFGASDPAQTIADLKVAVTTAQAKQTLHD